ncbi:MAG TPA: response regulator, partial [Leptospiraceae bacterium]|nr:response regulator [Leptospiraceae bacterium]
TQRIRQENLNYSPAIIALTANALEGEKQRCFEAGMDDYIAKPIDFERMFELIGRYSGEPEDKNGNS